MKRKDGSSKGEISQFWVFAAVIGFIWIFMTVLKCVGCYGQ